MMLAASNLGRQTRSASLVRSSLDHENRTIELAFSSEEPIERPWGVEILGHGTDEVDLGWLNTGRAPVLVSHDPDDHVGVVARAVIGSDRKGRAVVRFGSSARADEVFRDVRDGVRVNVSVGYEILSLDIVEKGSGKPDTYRATRWRPVELSLVSIPADMTVGVGRSSDQDKGSRSPVTHIVRTNMTTTNSNPEADVAAERQRCQGITFLGQRHNLIADADQRSMMGHHFRNFANTY
jgi:hypothetical protein